MIAILPWVPKKFLQELQNLTTAVPGIGIFEVYFFDHRPILYAWTAVLLGHYFEV